SPPPLPSFRGTVAPLPPPHGPEPQAPSAPPPHRPPGRLSSKTAAPPMPRIEFSQPSHSAHRKDILRHCASNPQDSPVSRLWREEKNESSSKLRRRVAFGTNSRPGRGGVN